MLIYKNFLLVRSDSWPRKWRVPKPLPNTLDRWQEIYQCHKFHLCDISALNFLPETIPKGRKLQPQGRNCKTTGPQKFTHPRNPFDLQKPETHSDRCTRCGDTLHAKGFQCPVRKFQCKAYRKFGHFTLVCYQKSQQSSDSFKHRKPKSTTTLSRGPIHQS